MAQTIEVLLKIRVDDDDAIERSIEGAFGSNDEGVGALHRMGVAGFVAQVIIESYVSHPWIQAVQILRSRKTGNVVDSIF